MAGNKSSLESKEVCVPLHLPCQFSTFLQRGCSEGWSEVTGERVDIGAGYGVTVPTFFSTLEIRCKLSNEVSGHFSGGSRDARIIG